MRFSEQFIGDTKVDEAGFFYHLKKNKVVYIDKISEGSNQNKQPGLGFLRGHLEWYWGINVSLIHAAWLKHRGVKLKKYA